MNRLFLNYLLDVAWRSCFWLAAAFVVILPPVLAWDFDRDTALITVAVVGTVAAFFYANRFGANLSWLQLAPISRSRLWWYNYVANVFPLALMLVFTLASIGLGRFLPAPPHAVPEVVATAPPAHAEPFVPFGSSGWPYALVLLALLHGVMIIPRSVIPRVRAPRWHYALACLYVAAFFALPGSVWMQGLRFAVLPITFGLVMTAASVRAIGLPREAARSFRLRYGAMTLVLTGLGLLAIW